MSLYYEAAAFLKNATENNELSSSSIYGKKDLKTKPAQIVALISQTAKWSAHLSSIIEHVEILRLERKLTPQLSILLTHDLLLSKHGIAAPKDHVLRLAIERHKARLTAEFTKARLRAGFSTIEDWRNAVETGAINPTGAEEGTTSDGLRHPRWIRINTLKTSLEDELDGSFAGFSRTSLSSVTSPSSATSTISQLALDQHIGNLVAVPETLDTTFTSSQAYRAGKLIFQDKASCFPAYLLDPSTSDGDIIDACSAPGNKTTHLAALLTEARKDANGGSLPTQRIFACERDKIRAGTLQKMVRIAGADKYGLVQCLPGQDFLRLDPQDTRWKNVGALLLDPSCSGSGIVGRDEDIAADMLPSVSLPRLPDVMEAERKNVINKGKKRKRGGNTEPAKTPKTASSTKTPPADSSLLPTNSGTTSDHTIRLQNLSNFQIKLLKHALSFPAARKVIYSTCSIHAQENEIVVLRALTSNIARNRGWRILKREEQVKGMREWDVRGVVVDAVGDDAGGNKTMNQDTKNGQNGRTDTWTEEEAQAVAEAVIRCEKGTAAGTMGFFVAGFIREDKVSHQLEADDEDEFEGFDDEDE